MTASFALELDTKPPTLVLERPRWSEGGLQVFYSIDEDGIVQADFNGEPVAWDGEKFYLAHRPEAGVLTVVAQDDVLNRNIRTLAVPASGTYADSDRTIAGYNAGIDDDFPDEGSSSYGGSTGSTYADTDRSDSHYDN